jgi:hypothetical protein
MYLHEKKIWLQLCAVAAAQTVKWPERALRQIRDNFARRMGSGCIGSGKSAENRRFLRSRALSPESR